MEPVDYRKARLVRKSLLVLKLYFEVKLGVIEISKLTNLKVSQVKNIIETKDTPEGKTVNLQSKINFIKPKQNE